MLQDSFGRVATDLRVSLTDRCNLRCSYCMPPEGLDWLPKPELLTDDEVIRLVAIGGRAAGHHRGPLHRRRAAAAPRAGRHRRPAPPRSGPRPQVSLDHQRHRAGPAGRPARRGGPATG